MLFGLGAWEIALIVFFGLVLFGSSLPLVARNLGKTLTDVNKEVKTIREDLEDPTRK